MDIWVTRLSEPPGLGNGFLDTDDNLAVEAPRLLLDPPTVRIIEGDDIRRAVVPEEGFVEPGHFGLAHEADPELESFFRQQIAEQDQGDPAQAPHVDGNRALAVPDGQGAAQGSSASRTGRALPRCSS